MSEIKNAGYTWMALNTWKCNHRMTLGFKGLIAETIAITRILLVTFSNCSSTKSAVETALIDCEL